MLVDLFHAVTMNRDWSFQALKRSKSTIKHHESGLYDLCFIWCLLKSSDSFLWEMDWNSSKRIELETHVSSICEWNTHIGFANHISDSQKRFDSKEQFVHDSDILLSNFHEYAEMLKFSVNNLKFSLNTKSFSHKDIFWLQKTLNMVLWSLKALVLCGEKKVIQIWNDADLEWTFWNVHFWMNDSLNGIKRTSFCYFFKES